MDAKLGLVGVLLLVLFFSTSRNVFNLDTDRGEYF